MNRTLSVLGVFAFTTLFFMSSVAAVPTSQGLEWGIALGSRANLTLEVDFSGLELDESMYINVTSMPAAAIPDPTTTWLSLPDPSLGFWWANGTSMGLVAFLFVPVIATGGQYIAPVGNWTLLQSLLAPLITGEEFSSPTNLWQVVWSQDINSTAEQRITSAYSTVDGFLSVYKWEFWNTVTNTLVEYVHATRTVIPSAGFDVVQFVKDNMLLVGGGVVVLLVLGVVCAKRK